MDIKKLQNDYTTPEQSKRLLELGVPADSADCYTSDVLKVALIGDCTGFNKAYEAIKKFHHVEVSPIWSVGRLMEIWEICGNGGRCVTVKKGQSRIESLVKLYEENAFYADFSKLEDKL